MSKELDVMTKIETILEKAKLSEQELGRAIGWLVSKYSSKEKSFNPLVARAEPAVIRELPTQLIPTQFTPADNSGITYTFGYGSSTTDPVPNTQ